MESDLHIYIPPCPTYIHSHYQHLDEQAFSFILSDLDVSTATPIPTISLPYSSLTNKPLLTSIEVELHARTALGQSVKAHVHNWAPSVLYPVDEHQVAVIREKLIALKQLGNNENGLGISLDIEELIAIDRHSLMLWARGFALQCDAAIHNKLYHEARLKQSSSTSSLASFQLSALQTKYSHNNDQDLSTARVDQYDPDLDDDCDDDIGPKHQRNRPNQTQTQSNNSTNRTQTRYNQRTTQTQRNTPQTTTPTTDQFNLAPLDNSDQILHDGNYGGVDASYATVSFNPLINVDGIRSHPKARGNEIKSNRRDDSIKLNQNIQSRETQIQTPLPEQIVSYIQSAYITYQRNIYGYHPHPSRYVKLYISHPSANRILNTILPSVSMGHIPPHMLFLLEIGLSLGDIISSQHIRWRAPLPKPIIDQSLVLKKNQQTHSNPIFFTQQFLSDNNINCTIYDVYNRYLYVKDMFPERKDYEIGLEVLDYFTKLQNENYLHNLQINSKMDASAGNGEGYTNMNNIEEKNSSSNPSLNTTMGINLTLGPYPSQDLSLVHVNTRTTSDIITCYHQLNIPTRDYKRALNFITRKYDSHSKNPKPSLTQAPNPTFNHLQQDQQDENGTGCDSSSINPLLEQITASNPHFGTKNELREHFDVLRLMSQLNCSCVFPYHPPIPIDQSSFDDDFLEREQGRIISIPVLQPFSTSLTSNRPNFHTILEFDQHTLPTSTLTPIKLISDRYPGNANKTRNTQLSLPLSSSNTSSRAPLRPNQLYYTPTPINHHRHCLTDLPRSATTDLEFDFQIWELNNATRWSGSESRWRDIQKQLFTQFNISLYHHYQQQDAQDGKQYPTVTGMKNNPKTPNNNTENRKIYQIPGATSTTSNINQAIGDIPTVDSTIAQKILQTQLSRGSTEHFLQSNPFHLGQPFYSSLATFDVIYSHYTASTSRPRLPETTPSSLAPEGKCLNFVADSDPFAGTIAQTPSGTLYRYSSETIDCKTTLDLTPHVFPNSISHHSATLSSSHNPSQFHLNAQFIVCSCTTSSPNTLSLNLPCSCNGCNANCIYNPITNQYFTKSSHSPLIIPSSQIVYCNCLYQLGCTSCHIHKTRILTLSQSTSDILFNFLSYQSQFGRANAFILGATKPPDDFIADHIQHRNNSPQNSISRHGHRVNTHTSLSHVNSADKILQSYINTESTTKWTRDIYYYGSNHFQQQEAQRQQQYQQEQQHNQPFTGSNIPALLKSQPTTQSTNSPPPLSFGGYLQFLHNQRQKVLSSKLVIPKLQSVIDTINLEVVIIQDAQNWLISLKRFIIDVCIGQDMFKPNGALTASNLDSQQSEQNRQHREMIKMARLPSIKKIIKMMTTPSPFKRKGVGQHYYSSQHGINTSTKGFGAGYGDYNRQYHGNVNQNKSDQNEPNSVLNNTSSSLHFNLPHTPSNGNPLSDNNSVGLQHSYSLSQSRPQNLGRDQNLASQLKTPARPRHGTRNPRELPSVAYETALKRNTPGQLSFKLSTVKKKVKLKKFQNDENEPCLEDCAQGNDHNLNLPQSFRSQNDGNEEKNPIYRIDSVQNGQDQDILKSPSDSIHSPLTKQTYQDHTPMIDYQETKLTPQKSPSVISPPTTDHSSSNIIIIPPKSPLPTLSFMSQNLFEHMFDKLAPLWLALAIDEVTKHDILFKGMPQIDNFKQNTTQSNQSSQQSHVSSSSFFPSPIKTPVKAPINPPNKTMSSLMTPQKKQLLNLSTPFKNSQNDLRTPQKNIECDNNSKFLSMNDESDQLVKDDRTARSPNQSQSQNQYHATLMTQHFAVDGDYAFGVNTTGDSLLTDDNTTLDPPTSTPKRPHKTSNISQHSQQLAHGFDTVPKPPYTTELQLQAADKCLSESNSHDCDKSSQSSDSVRTTSSKKTHTPTHAHYTTPLRRNHTPLCNTPSIVSLPTHSQRYDAASDNLEGFNLDADYFDQQFVHHDEKSDEDSDSLEDDNANESGLSDGNNNSAESEPEAPTIPTRNNSHDSTNHSQYNPSQFSQMGFLPSAQFFGDNDKNPFNSQDRNHSQNPTTSQGSQWNNASQFPGISSPNEDVTSQTTISTHASKN